jgi:thymidylate synthase (FAD)
MQIIKPGYSFINEPVATKKIERVARICYKSEDKIGEGTDVKMVKDLLNRQHTAMLEHATFAVSMDAGMFSILKEVVTNITTILYQEQPRELERNYLRYSAYLGPYDDKIQDFLPIRYIVSGNIRAWINAMDLLVSHIGFVFPKMMQDVLMQISPDIFGRYPYEEEYEDPDKLGYTPLFELITDYTTLHEEERMIHEDISILFTVDRGVTHELVRHRDCSFAQESTRYCNYNLGKFGNEITVIEPCFYAGRDDEYNAWVSAMEDAEKHYFDLINTGSKPQEARDVLPTSVKAEIVMTANLREWRHIFSLRACDATGPAHPQMKEVMVPCLKELRTGTYEFAFGDMVTADEVSK